MNYTNVARIVFRSSWQDLFISGIISVLGVFLLHLDIRIYALYKF